MFLLALIIGPLVAYLILGTILKASRRHDLFVASQTASGMVAERMAHLLFRPKT